MADATAARFWVKVDRTPTCWLWTAYTNLGYGVFTAGRMVKAHRWSWEQEHGPVPAGYHLHHTCEVRNCVNPAHLRLVTPSEHATIHGWQKNLAPDLGSDVNRRKTHCPQGHPYSGDNLYVSNAGRRNCKTCNRRRTREYYWRKKNEGN